MPERSSWTSCSRRAWPLDISNAKDGPRRALPTPALIRAGSIRPSAGPKPHAATRSPTLISNSPSEALAIPSAAASTAMICGGIACHSPNAARFNRIRSEDGFHVLICSSTQATAAARSAAKAALSKAASATITAVQRVPIVGPFRLWRVSVDIFKIAPLGLQGGNTQPQGSHCLIDFHRHGPRHCHAATDQNLPAHRDQPAQVGGIGMQAVLHIGAILAARKRRYKPRQPALGFLKADLLLIEKIGLRIARPEVKLDRPPRFQPPQEPRHRTHTATCRNHDQRSLPRCRTKGGVGANEGLNGLPRLQPVQMARADTTLHLANRNFKKAIGARRGQRIKPRQITSGRHDAHQITGLKRWQTCAEQARLWHRGKTENRGRCANLDPEITARDQAQALLGRNCGGGVKKLDKCQGFAQGPAPKPRNRRLTGGRSGTADGGPARRAPLSPPAPCRQSRNSAGTSGRQTRGLPQEPQAVSPAPDCPESGWPARGPRHRHRWRSELSSVWWPETDLSHSSQPYEPDAPPHAAQGAGCGQAPMSIRLRCPPESASRPARGGRYG